MPKLPETAGIILAGGRSSRMQGSDKALLPFGKVTFIENAVIRLSPQCHLILISSNSEDTSFRQFDCPIINDGPFLGRSPLAGIYAAMSWLGEHRPDIQWLTSIAVDTPFFPDDFVSRLHETQKTSGKLAVMAKSGGRQHPVNSLWSVKLISQLKQTLTENSHLSISRWLQERDCAEAVWDHSPIDPFMNINTPEEKRAIEQLLNKSAH
ncbi:molybdenum cofactor guanylyltransferase MobA [Microvirga sp. W0021]|uniref:Molybdenum cofactor guanylyltransferase n=1 Tax=Hohaiivirga grylli TaxID=3133970 RepID=A0ABV0BJE0_9HYPH